MNREYVETCDICGRKVSDVLQDDRSNGRGYIDTKRYRWKFGPFPKVWHREDLGWEIVCDFCLDEIKEARKKKMDARKETR